MSDTEAEKISEKLDRLLDPENGVFPRLQRLDYKVDGLVAQAEEDADAHDELRKRIESLETSRSRLKGWLAGVAASGGALGALASKLLGQ